jgi:DNA-binding transcriptional regulator GbsR (MarR family)
MTEAKEIKKSIYSAFAEIASTIGYSEIHGRIIAALLVSDRKLSLQDLAKETGYSISTISLSLDLLEFLGMIKKMKKAADRKLYVELQGDLLEGLKKAFMLKIQKSITDSLNSFENYKEILNRSKDKEKEKVMDVLSTLEKEIRRVDSYINLLSKLKLP